MKHAHPELGPPEQLAHGDFEIVVQRLAEDLAFGTDASLFTGSGLEYAQSRIYEPGDPIKQIDWKLSARTQRIHVKEYEALKRTAVYLLLDTSASMSVSSGGISKHDLGVWSAAAIGLVAQKRLSPCAIVGAGERRAIMRSGGSWLLLDTDKPFVPPLRHFLSSRALAGGGRA